MEPTEFETVLSELATGATRRRATSSVGGWMANGAISKEGEEHVSSPELDLRLSRRTLMLRTATLGLAVASGVVLLPHDVTRAATIDDPKFYRLPSKSRIISVGSKSLTNTRQVTAQGYISFNKDHVALMRGGREFRLRCAIYGADSGCASPDDFLFKLEKPKASIIYNKSLLSASQTTLKKEFIFQDVALSSRLNEDVNTTWDFCNDDEDDIQAYLIVETRPNSSTSSWSSVSTYQTDDVQGHF